MAKKGPSRGRRAIQSLVIGAFAAFFLFGHVSLAIRVAGASGGAYANAPVVDSGIAVHGSSKWGTRTSDVNHLSIDGRTVKVAMVKRFAEGSRIDVRYPAGEPDRAVLGGPEDGFFTMYVKNADGWGFWALLALGLLFLALALAYLKDAIVGPDPDDIV